MRILKSNFDFLEERWSLLEKIDDVVALTIDLGFKSKKNNKKYRYV